MAIPAIQSPTSSTLSTIINRSGAKSPTEALPLEILYNLQYQHKWTDLKLHQIALNTAGSSLSGTNSTANTTPPILDPSPLDLEPLSITASIQPDSLNTRSTSTSSSSHLSRSPQPSSSPSQASTSSSTPQVLISGLPPRHLYTHPDLLSHLVSVSKTPDSLPIEHEYVLPLAIGQPWSLRRMAGVFDALPVREGITVTATGSVGADGHVVTNGAETEDGGKKREGDSEGEGKAGGAYVHRDAKRVLLGMLGRNGVGGDGTVVYYVVQEGEVKPRQN